MRGNLRRLALPLAALLVLIAAGTAGGASKAATLVFAGASDPTYLDPALVSDGESFRVTEQIFEGLVSLKPGTTKIVASLATSWNLKGGKVWTFNLRKGVKFHDGTPFNAAAVCYNFNRWYNWTGPFQDPSATFYYQATYGGFKKNEVAKLSAPLFKSCKTVGKYRIVVQLCAPSGSVLPVARDPVVRDAEPDGDEEVRCRRGHADRRDVQADRHVRVPASDRHRPVQVRVVDDRPEGRARAVNGLLGQEGKAGQDHHPADLDQRGALPGAEDRRDQRLRPGAAAGHRESHR